MNVVCEVCGHIGYRHLLLRCRDCTCSATHQYCLENVVYDASLMEWLCYGCLQRRREVNCIRSLEKAPCERPLAPSHARFGSIIHQPIAKRVESARDAASWRNRKNKSFVNKYASVNKIYSSGKKLTKNKSNMRPMGTCMNGGRAAKIIAHTSAKASDFCEMIGTESAKSKNGKNQLADHENPGTLNIKQPSTLILNCLGTSGDTNQSHLLEAMEEFACKSKKTLTPLMESFKGLVTNRENVVLGSTGSSCSKVELGNTVLEQSGGKSDIMMKNSCANHDNQTNECALVGCKNMETRSSSAKENKTVVGADQNMYRAAGSLKNSMHKFEVHGDNNNNIIDSLVPQKEKEEVRFQPDYRARYELPKINIAATEQQLSTLQNDAVDKVMPHSPNDGWEEVLPCPGIKSIPTVRERSGDSIDISSISQHDTTEASEGSERFTECQKDSSHRRGKTLKMASASPSSDESGKDIPSENIYLESDDRPSSLGADYVLSYRTYLSETQKKRVTMLIQEIQPDFTVYIATMRKTTVQPPGPYLGITKEYALAYFPDKTTNVTLEMPGKSKKWHPKFYKENRSRKNFLMGQWLDFIHDNHVQEGDIVLLSPTKGGKRSIFAVYLLHETATRSSGGSSAKLASQVHIEEELTTGKGVIQESNMPEIPHEYLEREDSDNPFLPYIVPCKSPLSKSQKRIVEQRVRVIRSEVSLCVAVMKNNNVGVAQRWMLELGSRFGSAYLPTKGQTMVLQCGGKTWETKMMFHNGRRWFINGGWPNFARGNGLRVGDICLFELKEKEEKLTMEVHIIRKEQF